MANIFEWIGAKKEAEVLEMAREHMEKVRRTIQNLVKAVDAFTAGKKEELPALLHAVAQSEHEADLVRKQLMTSLSIGTFRPPDRADLMGFVSKMDSIADWAHTADRYIALWETSLPSGFGEFLKDFTATAEQSVEKVCEAVNSLSQSSKKTTLQFCEEVELLEEKADDQKRDNLKLIMHSGLDAAHLMIARDLIESIENISDAAESVADRIRVLMVEIE